MINSPNYVAFKTLIGKEIGRFLRIWPQTLLPSAITMTLYFVIFGNLIGSRIGNMDGYPYINYIVPGLVMMAVITGAYANTSSSFFSAKFQRSIEELLVSPMPNYLILLGYTLGGVLRGVLVGIIVLFISLFFTHLHVQNYFLMFVVMVLSAFLFALAGLINAIYARKFDDVSIIPTFVLTPLTYLGGVFYSIDLLPEFWHKVSLVNPILYMVNAFRYSFIGVSDINIYIAFALILVFSAVFYLINIYLLKQSVGLRS
ncbi:MAG: ABC transporter permease [Legionellales bacterium]|nr:ABC transporter permease [Legionellales bacterium]|tara:strand:+ start:377 stop:1150 length:774 start_codon:yes stop_codon:yes gene_type:complete